MSKPQEIRVPDIGNFADVPVIEVTVAVGDAIEAEDTLITLESDKASMDIPAPFAGKVAAIRVKPGDRVSEGSVILDLVPAAPASPQAAALAAEELTPKPAAPETTPPHRRAEDASPPVPADVPAPPAPEAPGRRSLVHASPSVRRLAREFGVDLARVRGSGPKKRILKEDVQAFVKAELEPPRGGRTAGGLALDLPEHPQVDFSRFGPVRSEALSKIKRISGAVLHRNWVMAPHVTQFHEADITELEAFRKGLKAEAEGRGQRVTLLPFLMKIAAAALAAHPEFNASLSPDGENLILKEYFHIGFAVDTPDGLVVPVVRDVDRKGVWAIAGELADHSERARRRKLAPADMQGGSFSISSLGGIGGHYFTPILNSPEVAILGVSRAQVRPVWDGSAFQPRLMLPLSLSYDHRVIDGAQGARFISTLEGLLTDPRRLLLG